MNNILLYEMTKYLSVRYCIENIGCMNSYLNNNIFNIFYGKDVITYGPFKNEALMIKIRKYCSIFICYEITPNGHKHIIYYLVGKINPSNKFAHFQYYMHDYINKY